MSVASVLFLAFVFLKQFYILPSGYLGIGDMALAACGLALLYKHFKAREYHVFYRKDFWLYLFGIGAVLINIFYFIKYRNMEFLQYTFFLIYNILAIWCFREISREPGTLLWQNRILKCSLLLQTAIYIFGWGRIYYEYWGATRYSGTFNNPNQMAYIIFLMLLLICVYEVSQGKSKVYYVWIGIGTFLVAVTKSTGVFLGCVILIAADILLEIYNRYKKAGRKIPRALVCILAAGGVVLLAVGLKALWPDKNFNIENTDYSLLARIQEKIYKFLNGGIIGIAYDRGWEKVFLYPKYLLTGSGEGMYERFPLAVWGGEIHSTILSVLFCYGIIPFVLVSLWIAGNLRKIENKFWPVYIALLAECATVINYRQPFFWMALVFAGILARDAGKQKAR